MRVDCTVCGQTMKSDGDINRFVCPNGCPIFEAHILSGDLAHGEVWRVEVAQFATDNKVMSWASQFRQQYPRCHQGFPNCVFCGEW
jgi:hypothetical protein